jgi:hypothetical protein
MAVRPSVPSVPEASTQTGLPVSRDSCWQASFINVYILELSLCLFDWNDEEEDLQYGASPGSLEVRRGRLTDTGGIDPMHGAICEMVKLRV